MTLSPELLACSGQRTSIMSGGGPQIGQESVVFSGRSLSSPTAKLFVRPTSACKERLACL